MIAPHHGQPYAHGERVDPGILRQILDAVRKLKIRAEWPLVIEPTTNTVYLDDDAADAAGGSNPTYIRITGAPVAGGRYPWIALVPSAATGDLVAGTESGTTDRDPAVELNGNMNVPHPYNAEAWRDAIGSLRFRASQCP